MGVKLVGDSTFRGGNVAGCKLFQCCLPRENEGPPVDLITVRLAIVCGVKILCHVEVFPTFFCFWRHVQKSRMLLITGFDRARNWAMVFKMSLSWTRGLFCICGHVGLTEHCSSVETLQFCFKIMCIALVRGFFRLSLVLCCI